ncbi:hypothetical protein CBE01nite_37440 [Clostridium beijerinckii]|nr:hypothetical protein CBE01nite_37440 [Clostridium beijerinckii]
MGELLSLFVFEFEQLYYLQNIEKYSLKIIKDYLKSIVASQFFIPAQDYLDYIQIYHHYLTYKYCCLNPH